MDSIQAIREALFASQDEAYRAFQCPLMPTVDPATVIGVRTPILRRMAKELRGKLGGEALVKNLPHAYFEENQLHAFLIESIRDFDTAVAATDTFLPYVDNWATCDQLSPKAFKGRFAELLPHIRRWMADPAPYTCRFGLGMLMRYGLGEDFDPGFLEEAAALSITAREHYYVRMMVAWFFATALTEQYEATLPYLTGHRLPMWTHNKAIQKACESYRVPSEHKVYLRSLRRKK
ncbi:MAG: DNA alkylation repair protein [Clostridia bacterium]|nr:DNA alkylation repair protein [Clostridia bacterium]